MNEIIEELKQILFDVEAKIDVKKALTFLDLASDSYVVIQFPEVQSLMEEDWFQKEAILDNSDNAESSTYFIPINRII